MPREKAASLFFSQKLEGLFRRESLPQGACAPDSLAANSVGVCLSNSIKTSLNTMGVGVGEEDVFAKYHRA